MLYHPRNNLRLSWLGVDMWHRAGYAGQGMKFCVVDADTDTRLARYPEKIHTYKDSGRTDWTKNHGGHGLLTIDIIQQICPESEIYFAGWQYSLTDCVHWAISNDVDITTVSLGYSWQSVTRQVSQEAIDSGMLLFTSAGNAGDLPEDLIGYPARKGTWIAVGAAIVNHWGTKPERVVYSSTGQELEVMGMTHLFCTLPAPYGDYIYTGTSCASPCLASIIGLMEQQHGDYTKAEIRELFETLCVDMQEPGRDRKTGWGMFRMPHPETGERMKEIVLQIDNQTVHIDGETTTIDTPPIIHNNRTMVPLSFIGRQLGASVEWNAETRQVRIRG